jgi:hypothetical protein
MGIRTTIVVEPPRESHDRNMENEMKSLAVILGSLAGILSLLIIAISIFFDLVIKKKQTPSTRSNNILLGSNSEANPHSIPLHVLEEVTDQFDEEKVIGTGGFGKV